MTRLIRLYSFAITVLSLIAVCRAAVEFTITQGKLSVASIDGSGRISEAFSLDKPPKVASPLTVESDEVLRLAFTLTDTSGEKLTDLPHQVAVLLSDPQDNSIASTSIVSVKRISGKASWSQRIDRLPGIFYQSQSGKIQITLLLGSFSSSSPTALPLATIQLPSITSIPSQTSLRHQKEVQFGFHRHQDHHHTFAIGAAETMPPKIISIIASFVTLIIPWAILSALLSQIFPTLNTKSMSSASTQLFASIIALEILAFIYWHGIFSLTLFKMLPWLGLLSIVTLFTGRNALSEMKKARVVSDK